MDQAWTNWIADNRPPTLADGMAIQNAARLQKWARDAFYEGYLAGFLHASDTAKTAMREAHEAVAPMAVNHDIPT